MTNLLSIQAPPEAAVACDMTAAEDTLAVRVSEYRRLFDHALVHRESTGSATTFRFADRPGERDWVLDLVRREAACCPFLSYRVDLDEDHIVWRISGLGASDMAVLDEFLADADPAQSSTLIAHQLEALGGIPVIVVENAYCIGDSAISDRASCYERATNLRSTAPDTRVLEAATPGGRVAPLS